MPSPPHGSSSPRSSGERRRANGWYDDGLHTFTVPHRLARLILAAVLLVLLAAVLHALLSVTGLDVDPVELWNSLPPEFVWSIDGRP